MAAYDDAKARGAQRCLSWLFSSRPRSLCLFAAYAALCGGIIAAGSHYTRTAPDGPAPDGVLGPSFAGGAVIFLVPVLMYLYSDAGRRVFCGRRAAATARQGCGNGVRRPAYV